MTGEAPSKKVRLKLWKYTFRPPRKAVRKPARGLVVGPPRVFVLMIGG